MHFLSFKKTPLVIDYKKDKDNNNGIKYNKLAKKRH